ncbi:MAG: hypothetical protein O7G87_14355 [bacterium]|nr:hypothetical protein [bacterium]
MSRRILVVYRNEHIRVGIEEMLKETESAVWVAASRQEALAYALLESFDLAIVDRTLIEGPAGCLFKARLNELGVPVLPAAPERAWMSQDRPILPMAL